MQRETTVTSTTVRNLTNKNQPRFKLQLGIPAKANLSTEELELYELAVLADIHLDPKVFKIIWDLLQLNVSPTAIMEMLKCMSTSCHQGKVPPPSTQGDNIKQSAHKKR